jgi:hypothetical protein
LSRGQNTFKCALCYEEHFIPGNGFQVSKQIQNALDIGFNESEIEIGVFAECKKTENSIFRGASLFLINSESNCEECSSSFGLSYKHSNYERDTERAQSILAGSQDFLTVDNEVFTKLI